MSTRKTKREDGVKEMKDNKKEVKGPKMAPASKKNKNPIDLETIEFQIRESYKAARTNIVYSIIKKGCKKISFTSVSKSEGKTITSVNIAIALAKQVNTKVLIIDCDMRNPTVGKALQIKNTAGMAEYLTTNASVRDIISGTKIENLSVITGGTNVKAGYAELLSDKRLGQLVKAASTLFDYVILDTPPCSLLADAAEVGSVADTAFIVIRHDFASQEQIMDGVRGLSDCGVPIMGCVLNGIEHGFSTGYGYGYGYGHGYGYGYSYRHSYGYGNNGK
jgi:receptor protein-tyrosine kinase